VQVFRKAEALAKRERTAVQGLQEHRDQLDYRLGRHFVVHFNGKIWVDEPKGAGASLHALLVGRSK
jgi:hypothetical protein